jgi:nucleoside-diphosphate-sugar epimerase
MPQSSQQRILITGGAGYVGSLLSLHLASRGHHVTAYDNLRSDSSAVCTLVSSGVNFVRGDVRDSTALSRELVRADIILHLAALVGFPACQSAPKEARETICNSTNTILHSLSPQQRLIYASTGSIYGKLEGICEETVQPKPQSLYGELKLAADTATRDAGGIALRFATLFGVSPCMRLDLLPNAFCWQAARQKYLVLYRGSDRRTFLHVRDAVRAYECVIDALLNGDDFGCGQAYNVGAESLNMTKLQLAEAIRQQCDFDLVNDAVNGTDPDFRDYAVSYRKFAIAFGFVPKISLQDGIGELLQVARAGAVNLPWRLVG